MNRLEELLSTLGATDLKDKAVEKTDEWAREFKKASRGFVKNIKNLDLDFANNQIVDSVRDNISAAVDMVNSSDVMELAKTKVAETRKQVLSVLRIPSQTEIDGLTRKIVSLEKKVQAISKRVAK